MIEYTRHAEDNMLERGATREEVDETIRDGSESTSARPPAMSRSLVFRDGYYSKDRWYQHKEVRPIYVIEDNLVVVLTVMVRYGFWELEE